MTDKIPDDIQQVIDRVTNDILENVTSGFDSFMREAVCSKQIRAKGMEETAKAVYAAGWSDGFLHAKVHAPCWRERPTVPGGWHTAKHRGIFIASEAILKHTAFDDGPYYGPIPERSET